MFRSIVKAIYCVADSVGRLNATTGRLEIAMSSIEAELVDKRKRDGRRNRQAKPEATDNAMGV